MKRNQFVRTIVGFVFIMGISAMAVSCGQHKKTSDGDVALRVNVSGSSYEIQVFDEIKKQFEEENPDIKVEYIDIGNDRLPKTMSMIQSGNPPDIFFLNESVRYMASKGVLAPLDDFIEADKNFDLSRFPSVGIEPQTWEGQVYALPIEVTPYVMYYNVDMFKKYGVPLPENDWTQGEFYAAAKALTIPEEKIYGYQSLSNWHNITLGWLERAGGSLLSEDQSSCALDTPEALSALTFLYDMTVVDKISIDPAEAASMGTTGVDVMFRNQKAAMISAAMWDVPIFRDNPLEFEYNVVKMPRNKNQDTKANCTLWAISSASEHPKEAWKFLSYMVSEQGMKLLAQAEYSVPAARDAAADEVIKSIKYPENAAVFIDAAEDINLEVDKSPQKMEVIDTWNAGMERLMMGEMSPEECQKWLIREINKILEEP